MFLQRFLNFFGVLRKRSGIANIRFFVIVLVLRGQLTFLSRFRFLSIYFVVVFAWLLIVFQSERKFNFFVNVIVILRHQALSRLVKLTLALQVFEFIALGFLGFVNALRGVLTDLGLLSDVITLLLEHELFSILNEFL